MSNTLPTLYKKTSTGKIQQWGVAVDEHDNVAEVVTVYGQVGGAMQMGKELISEGKNVGRSNATTAVEQAHVQARQEWDSKKKKGYVETISAAMAGEVDTAVITGGVAPMLAHKFHEQGHKISFPAAFQPKLDGHRCIAIVQDGVCTLWSRTQKPIFSSPHIVAELEARFPTGQYVFDGELYNHAYRDKFDKLSSKIRQSKPVAGYEDIQYWIYDLISTEPFEDRFTQLEESITPDSEHIRILLTFKVDDEGAMMERFQGSLDRGFEGGIVRNLGGRYVNKRSYDLQKVKEFDDAEFEVVDVVEGVGKMAGKGIFVCKTEVGDQFSCKMVGNMDALTEYFVNKQEYIGKMLTVKYFGISGKNSVPRFPVAMRLRED